MTATIVSEGPSAQIEFNGKTVTAKFSRYSDGKFRLFLDSRFRLICDPLNMSDSLGWNGDLYDATTKTKHRITYWHGGDYGHTTDAHRSMKNLIENALKTARKLVSA